MRAWAAGNRGDCAGAAIGAVYFIRMTVRAALAYSVAGSGNEQVTSALNDFSWAVIVLGWFPIAMLVMAGSFGLWRAGIFSSAAFQGGGNRHGAPPARHDDLGGRRLLGGGRWVCAVRPDDRDAPLDRGRQRFLVRRPSAASAPEQSAVPAM